MTADPGTRAARSLDPAAPATRAASPDSRAPGTGVASPGSRGPASSASPGPGLPASPGSGSPASAPADGVLIVGYGNPLRSDDGVGPVVAERLASDPRFAGADVQSLHQLTPELAFDASRSWLLVLVDAAEGVAAGEVVVRELGPAGSAGGADPGLAGRAEEGGPPLTHHVDPASLLGLAGELWDAVPRTLLVGIGPATLDLGERLSPEVEAAVPRAIDAVAAAMADLRDARTASRAGEG